MFNSYKFNQVKLNSEASFGINKTITASVLTITSSILNRTLIIKKLPNNLSSVFVINNANKSILFNQSNLSLNLYLGQSVVIGDVVLTVRKPRFKINKHNDLHNVTKHQLLGSGV